MENDVNFVSYINSKLEHITVYMYILDRKSAPLIGHDSVNYGAFNKQQF